MNAGACVVVESGDYGPVWFFNVNALPEFLPCENVTIIDAD
jgi:hypothetical protein